MFFARADLKQISLQEIASGVVPISVPMEALVISEMPKRNDDCENKRKNQKPDLTAS